MMHWPFTCTLLAATVTTVISQCNPINDHCCGYPQFGQITCQFERGRADVISRFPGGPFRPLNAWMYTEIYMGPNCVVEWDPPNIQENFPRLKFFVWDDMCNKTCIPPPPIEGAVLMNICIDDGSTITKAQLNDAATRQTVIDMPQEIKIPDRPILMANNEFVTDVDILNEEVIDNDVSFNTTDIPEVLNDTCTDSWRPEACTQVINGSVETCENEFIKNNCRRSCNICPNVTECRDIMDTYLCKGLRPVHKCEDQRFVRVCQSTCGECKLLLIDNDPTDTNFVTPAPFFITISTLLTPTSTSTSTTLQSTISTSTISPIEDSFDFDADYSDETLAVADLTSRTQFNQTDIRIPQPNNNTCSMLLRNGVPLESFYPTPQGDSHIVGVFLCPPGQTPTLFTCINSKWTIGGHEAACGVPPTTAPSAPQARPTGTAELITPTAPPAADNLISEHKSNQGPQKTLLRGKTFVTPELEGFTRGEACKDRLETQSCLLLTAHCHTREVSDKCALTCGLCVTTDVTVLPNGMRTPCEDSLPTKQCEANINFCNDLVFRIELCPATCASCDKLNL